MNEESERELYALCCGGLTDSLGCKTESFFLPPHLSQLKNVYDCLPDPDRKTAALVSLQTGCGSSTTQPLHRAQSASCVILHKPPEAQDLDQNRGHQHEEQGQA